MTAPRRFPPPGVIGKHPEVVHDSTEQALAYVYFEDERTSLSPQSAYSLRPFSQSSRKTSAMARSSSLA